MSIKTLLKEKLLITKLWLNKEEPLKYNLTFDELIKSFVVIIPIHSILYLWSYYSNFGAQYFLYFNPVDFITVFYSNNITFLILALLIGVLFIYFLINPDVISFLKVKTNILLSTLFLIFLIIIFYYWLKVGFSNFYGFACIGIMIFIVAIIYKQTRLIYYAVVFFYFFYTLNLAKNDALATKENKPNFNIILNDNSYVLKQDTINHKDYFIGKVTDYLFIYSDSLKSVRVIPVNDIKEIQFPLVK